jgi:hypothetical protein
MRIAVHAGFHKTGTTSFQNLILANMKLAPAGIRFEVPHLPLIIRFREALKVYHLSQSAVDYDAMRHAFATIVNESHNAKESTLFVSLETICGRVFGPWERGVYPTARPVLEMIAQVSEEHDLTFLFSTRNPDTWVRSVHAHMTQHYGLRIPLAEFVQLDTFRAIDWDDLVKTFTNGLGAKVHVASLEESKDLRLGPLSSFLDLFLDEPELSRWQPVPPANLSISPAAIKLVQSRLMRSLPDRMRGYVIRKMNSKSKRR